MIKKLLLGLLLIGGLGLQSLYSQNLTISGGWRYSLTICANGRVFAWGDNLSTTPPGYRLGVGSTDDYVTTPQEVLLPAGLEVNMVDAGSGGHAIAVDCNSTVWSWGENSQHQTGTTDDFVVVEVPARVRAGEGPSDADGYLSNISYITGATDASFAVVDPDFPGAGGRVLAWGNNNLGQMGIGITGGTQATPVFVKTGPTTYLENVTQVDAADAACFALVDDNNDGFGIVYAWGDGVALGDEGSTYARPILKEDGTVLDNIRVISAGDVHCFGIDANGNLWGWGNDGWGGLVGAGVGTIHPFAARVTGGATGEQFLSNVRTVNAGQGFSMAVLETGEALAWGNNTIDDSGGSLGTGATPASTAGLGPQYMRYNATTIVENAMDISRGDTWGFLVTDQNEIYTWGNNSRGQLGIGSTINQPYLVPFTQHPDCSTPDPCPAVYTPDSIYVCPNEEATIRSGFLTPFGMGTRYSFSWEYSDDGGITWNPATPVVGTTTNAEEITVDEIGLYRITVEYIGTDVPCNACEPVSSLVELAYYTPPFADPGGLEFCIDDIMPNVSGNGDYYWYGVQEDGTLLGHSEGEDPTETPLNATGLIPTSTNPDVYQFWVEDRASYQGYLRTNETDFSSPVGNACDIGQSQGGRLVFDSHTDFVIEEMDVDLVCYNPTSGKVRVVVIDTTTGSTLSASEVDVMCPGSGTYRVTLLDMGIEVPEQNGLAIGVESGTGLIGIDWYGDGPAGWMPRTETVDGNDVLTITENNMTPGYLPWSSISMFNWKITKGTPYPCGRVPVEVTIKDPSECSPCVQDTLIERCAGDNIVDLVALEDYVTCRNTQVNSSTVTWYNSVDGLIANESAYPAIDGDHVYAVVIGNGDRDTAYVNFQINPLPAVALDFTGILPVCEQAGLTVDLAAGAIPSGTSLTTVFTSVDAPVTSAGILDASAAGEWDVKYIVTNDTTGCVDSVTAVAVVDSVPEVVFATTAPYAYCENESGATITVETVTGASYSWLQDDVADSQTTYSITATGSATGSEWKAIVTLPSGCADTSDAVTVVENELPSFVFSGGQNYCYGVDPENLVVDLTGQLGYTITYQRTGSLPVSDTATSNTYEIENVLVGEYCITEIIDGNGCVLTTDSCETVTQSDSIEINTTPGSICSDIDNNNLRSLLALSEPANGSGVFTGVTPSGTITDAGIFTHGGNAETYTVSYTFTNDEGCEQSIDEQFIVNSSLIPVIVGDTSLSTCQNAAITVKTAVPYTNYVWSMTNLTLLSSTTIAEPSFSADVAPGDIQISVIVEDTYGCAGESDTIIRVHPVPTAYFADLDDSVCTEATGVVVEAIPSVTGGTGVYTVNGTGVIDAASGAFDPLASGAGTYIVTFNYTNPISEGSCELSPAIDTTIVVNPKPETSIDYPDYNPLYGICVYADSIQAVLSDTDGNVNLSISPSTTGFNTTTGAFDPEVAGVGTYTVTYSYTDDNGCAADDVIFEIVVNPAPVIDISMNPATLCDYSDPITLQAELDDGTDISSIGIFSGSGAGISTGSFTPVINTENDTVSITFRYSDPATQCADTVTHDIVVYHTEVLESITHSNLNSEIASQADLSAFCPAGTDIKWYEQNDITSTLLDEAACYTISYVHDASTGFMSAVSSPYYVYATQTLNGCQSVPNRFTYNISDCPAPAPIAGDFYSCEGDAVRAVRAIGGESGITATLGWWTTEPSNPILGDEEFAGLEWDAHGITGVGVHTLYVAEYSSAGTCYGPYTEVTLEVKPAPSISIFDLDTAVCSGTSTVQIDYLPSNAVLSGAGTNSTNIWTTQVNDPLITEVTTTDLTIDAEKFWGTDTTGATCINDTTFTMYVTNVVAPTGTGIGPNDTVITGVEVVPSIIDMVISRHADANVSVVNENNVEIATDTQTDGGFNLYTAGHILANVEDVYSYDVSQTLNECVSPIAVSNWKVVECPTEFPVITDLDTCYGLPIPVFENIHPTGINTEWYDASMTLLTTADTFDPIADGGSQYAEPGLYTFYASQEDTNQFTGLLCRGDLLEFTLTIHELPEFEITLSKSTPACFDASESDLEIRVAQTNSNTVVDWVYALDGDETVIQEGTNKGFLDPMAAELLITQYQDYGLHQYPVTVTATDDNICSFENTVTVSVQYTAPPTLTGVNQLVDETSTDNAEISAVEDSITWYRYASMSGVLSTDNPYITTLPMNTAVSNRAFYATQIENACESDTAETFVNLYDCPIPTPEDIIVNDICPYTTLPTFTASSIPDASWDMPPSGDPREYRWYRLTASGANYVPGVDYFAGDDYTPNTSVAGDIDLNTDNLLTEGTYSWYVTEYDAGYDCESPQPRLVELTINKTDPVNVYPVADSCAGQQMPLVTAFSGAGDLHWYTSIPDNANPVAGFTNATRNYTPPMQTTDGTYSVWVTEFEDGCYSIATEVEYTINPTPQPPVVTDVSVCSADATFPNLEADATAGNTIKWYDDTYDFLRNDPYSRPTDINHRLAGDYTYYATQTNSHGCESDFSLPLIFTINENPAQANVETLPMCEDDGSFPNFNLSGGGQISVYIGSVLKASNVTNFTPSANDTVGITNDEVNYNAIVESADGCLSEPAYFNLEIIRKPQTPYFRSTIPPICLGDDIRSLYARNDARDSIYWTYNSSVVATEESFSVDDIIEANGDGVYRFNAIAVFPIQGIECESDAVTATVTVNPIPSPPAILGGNTFCEPNRVFIRTDQDVKWYDIDGYSMNNIASDTMTFAQRYWYIQDPAVETRTYAFIAKAVDGIGCMSEDTILGFTVGNKPAFTVPDSIPLCYGQQQVQSYAATPDTSSRSYLYEWYSFDNDFLTDSSVFIPSEDFVEDSAYRYKVMCSDMNTGCKSDTVRIQLYSAPLPVTSIRGRTKVCESSSKEIYTVDEIDLENYYVWEHFGGDRIVYKEGDKDQIYRVDWDTVGIDMIKVTETTPFGCVAEDSIFVSVAKNPIADFDWEFPGAQLSATYENLTIQDTIFNEFDTLIVPYTSYWYYGRPTDVFPATHGYEQRNRIDTVNYTYGYYDITLRIENDHGCVDEVTYNIYADITTALYVPNAFSPGSAGSALREFIPKGFNLATYELSIFDMWGNMLFYSDELSPEGRPARGWDGTYDGVPLKTDTYIWKIEATFLDDSEWKGMKTESGKLSKYGSVILVR